MSFQLDPDAPIPHEARRLARAEIDAALAALDDPGRLGLDTTVHEVRKGCKRLRGLARLVPHPRRGDRRRFDAAVRDAARALGPLRDARAVLATFDDVVAATDGERELDSVRAALVLRAPEGAAGDDATRDALAAAAERLRQARGRLDRWAPDDDVRLVLDGLARNHARGRTAYRTVRERPTDEALHDWRKRAKYGWHHLSLLHPLAPGTLGPLAVQLERLSDGLGDDHDLAVLRADVAGDPHAFGVTAAEDALARIDVVRADLQDRCLRVGARLYAESPRAFAKRVGRYWEAWDELGRERPVGEIADLAAGPADRPPRRAPGAAIA